MITIKCEGMEKFTEMLDARKVPYAVSMALTNTAKDVKIAIQKRMPEVFDRPIPWTTNAMQVTPARKDNLSAEVWWKWPTGARPDKHYMVTQVEGAPRSRTRTEKMIGGLPGLAGKYFVPTQFAKLDRYGNWSSGERNQVLSALGAFGECGYMANRTARSAKRGRGKQQEYFVVSQPHGGLQPGIYRRVQTGATFTGKTSRSLQAGKAFQKGQTSGRFSSVIGARGAVPILIPAKGVPKYGKRLPFYEIAEQTRVRVMEGYLTEAAIKVLGWPPR